MACHTLLRRCYINNLSVYKGLRSSRATTIHVSNVYWTPNTVNVYSHSLITQLSTNLRNYHRETENTRDITGWHQMKKQILPYVQLSRSNRPIGAFLLFWPCGWSIALSTSAGCWPDPWLLGIFASGAFVMRSAGCTINDMWDKDIDSKVARTKDRPMASGQIKTFDALVFLSAQLGVALLLLLQLNWYSVVLGASSLGLVIVYPLMKRITYWPQLMLGMTFNWGALMGWSAVHGEICWAACLPLYLAGVSWTIVYDTIYAHQDKKDDLLIGIKSTALKFGNNTKLYLSGFSAAMISSLIASGVVCSQSWPYYTTVGLVAAHLAHQLASLNINNPKDCHEKFISNHQVGFLLFIGIVLGSLVKDVDDKSSENRKQMPSVTLVPHLENSHKSLDTI